MSQSPRLSLAAVGSIAAALAALAALVASPPSSAAPTVRLAPANVIEEPIESRVAALRRAGDLAGVRHSPELARAAEAHARALARTGTFAHDIPGGKPFAARLQRFYPARGYAHWATGENIYWAQAAPSPEAVVRAWLASPPHRAVLYDPLWREVGVAAVRAQAAPGVYGGRDVTIVVIELGLRRR
jgi:uncharacterized protein YkwD